jgi:hypothetical protein
MTAVHVCTCTERPGPVGGTSVRIIWIGIHARTTLPSVIP